MFHPGCFLFLDPWSEPVGNTRHPSRVTSHPVAASGGGTIIPHARGTGLGRAGPTLITACRSHKGKRSADPDPARVIEPRGVRRTCRPLRSGRLEGSPFRQLTEGRVTPESTQQLAGQRHNRDPADAAALRSDPLTEPAAQNRAGLVAQPQPGKLNQGGALPDWAIPCSRSTLPLGHGLGANPA